MANAATNEVEPLIRTIFRGTNWEKLPYQPYPIRIYPSERIATLIPHNKPTWSVRSLLPTDSDIAKASREITREKLHHLLRLSALPIPNERRENEMLETLRRQVHFVKQVQRVDTEGVEPLVCIRDETAEHAETTTLGLAQLKPWLDREDVDRNGTVRLRKPTRTWWRTWDVFKLGKDCGASFPRTQGRYFVLKRRGNRTDQALMEQGNDRQNLMNRNRAIDEELKGTRPLAFRKQMSAKIKTAAPVNIRRLVTPVNIRRLATPVNIRRLATPVNIRRLATVKVERIVTRRFRKQAGRSRGPRRKMSVMSLKTHTY